MDIQIPIVLGMDCLAPSNLAPVLQVLLQHLGVEGEEQGILTEHNNVCPGSDNIGPINPPDPDLSQALPLSSP